MSGGLAYQWTQDANKFGLVQANSDGSVDLLVDYDNFQAQLNNNKDVITKLETTSPVASKNKVANCSPKLITSSSFSKDFKIPSVPSGGQTLIDNGIPNPPVGKLVQVTTTDVSSKVTGSNGKSITGLKLNIFNNNESNTPSGANTSGSGTGTSGSGAGSGTGSAPSSSSSTADGVRKDPGSHLGLFVMAALAVLIL